MVVTSPTRIRHFEDCEIPTSDGEVLRAKLAMPKPPMSPQRVVLISPLVGAGAGQPLLTFRNFARRGAIVVSYEYRGHPLSTGTFELDKTIQDTRDALIWAAEYAKDQGLPLHGFATCYGTIPLLAQFREGGCGRLLRSVNTISGLYHLNQILRIDDFAPILSRYLNRDLDAPAMLEGIADGTLDCHALPFREALRDYLSGLMPELRVGLDGFEELQYSRVNLRQTLLQFSRADYLNGVDVPPWIPCTACVGQQDHLFSAHLPEGRRIYKMNVKSVVPHAMLYEFDMDHFGRGPGHDPVIDCVADAFERYDTCHVPPPHLRHNPPTSLSTSDSAAMNAVLQFWKDQYRIDRPLEADWRLSRMVNRYVVAGMMNAFPHAATRVLSLSRGELARLLFVEREGGSYRSLRAMYEYEDPKKRGDLINRLLMQSPAVKAARNRRKIAQQMLRQRLEAQPSNLPALVLAIGGGDGRLEAEVLAQFPRRDVYYCAVDKDERASVEIGETLKQCGLEGRGFVFLGNVAEKRDVQAVLDAATRRYGIPFPGADITVCHGITEYLDMGQTTNETLGSLLTAIHGCTRAEGCLIISQTDYHDRVKWLEQGLSWYMRLRGLDEVAAEVERAGWQISVCEHEPMCLITMCLAVKSNVKRRRIDSPSQLKRTPVSVKQRR